MYTELFNAMYHPYLVTSFLLIFYPYISLYFNSCLVWFMSFLWCKLELQFAISHRAAKSWFSLASSVDVCSMG